jgi:NADH-quinone oxidoreductase subunit C
MLNQSFVDRINSKFPDSKATLIEREASDPVLVVEPKSLKAVAQYLKDEPDIFMNVLQVVTGCDYSDRIEVSYILCSYPSGNEIILRVKLDRQKPEVESLDSLWKAANFQERECFDMLGVKFLNHPDPRRILCPDDWEGFPLRKDYVAAKSYRNMEIYPPEKTNLSEREFAKKQKSKAGSSGSEQDHQEAQES